MRRKITCLVLALLMALAMFPAEPAKAAGRASITFAKRSYGALNPGVMVKIKNTGKKPLDASFDLVATLPKGKEKAASATIYGVKAGETKYFYTELPHGTVKVAMKNKEATPSTAEISEWGVTKKKEKADGDPAVRITVTRPDSPMDTYSRGLAVYFIRGGKTVLSDNSFSSVYDTWESLHCYKKGDKVRYSVTATSVSTWQ